MSFTFTKNLDDVTVSFEAEKMIDGFKTLAAVTEVFGVNMCGKCKGTSLTRVVRKNKDEDEFYEIRCDNHKCRAKLELGVHKGKEGGLYTKRMKDGAYLPDNGWLRWNPETKENE